MTQEEKARAYDEALDRARELYEKDSVFDSEKTLIRCIFPELKENEIKDMREKLIKAFGSIGKKEWGGVNVKDVIHWLEKQGESYTNNDVDDAYLKGICDAKHELEKQGNSVKECLYLPHFTFDDVLALQCCMETVKKVQEDKKLYEALSLLHSKVYDAYHLEKQGEQKPVVDFKAKDWCVSEVDGQIHNMTYNSANKVEPKFKVGDWIVTDKGNTIQISTVNHNYYTMNNMDNEIYFDMSYVDNCCHLWTIKDAKNGDVLACGDKVTDCPFIFHNLTEELNPRSYCGVNLLRHFQDNDENGGFWCHSNEVRPATKEQRDLLFQKMEEAGYQWDGEKKELKKIEKKPVLDFKASNWYVSKVDGKIHDMTYNPADKVEPRFKVKYAGSEYNVLEVKDIAGVTFYGIEDEPNHIDYVKAENCEIISGYAIKENGSPYPTKPAVFSEKKPAAWSDEDEKMYKIALSCIETLEDISNGKNMHADVKEWIKSLKNRIGG